MQVRGISSAPEEGARRFRQARTPAQMLSQPAADRGLNPTSQKAPLPASRVSQGDPQHPGPQLEPASWTPNIWLLASRTTDGPWGRGALETPGSDLPRRAPSLDLPTQARNKSGEKHELASLGGRGGPPRVPHLQARDNKTPFIDSGHDPTRLRVSAQ